MADQATWGVASVLGVPNPRGAAQYIDTLGFAFAEGAGDFAGVGREGAGGVYANVCRPKKASILRAPQDEAYGLRDFTIEDPFGFRIAFGTALER